MDRRQLFQLILASSVVAVVPIKKKIAPIRKKECRIFEPSEHDYTAEEWCRKDDMHT